MTVAELGVAVVVRQGIGLVWLLKNHSSQNCIIALIPLPILIILRKYTLAKTRLQRGCSYGNYRGVVNP